MEVFSMNKDGEGSHSDHRCGGAWALGISQTWKYPDPKNEDVAERKK